MNTYKVKFTDRKGRTSTVGEYRQKHIANARIVSIAMAQKDIGAYWATPPHESFSIARACWRDGTYIEVWRAGQVCS